MLRVSQTQSYVDYQVPADSYDPEGGTEHLHLTPPEGGHLHLTGKGILYISSHTTTIPSTVTFFPSIPITSKKLITLYFKLRIFMGVEPCLCQSHE